MGHIELARWPQRIVIAPATADFIARLAHGLADDLLSTLCLATDAPIVVAPAMNRLMWSNAATQANVAALRQRGFTILGPAEGAQACGETGAGRMVEPQAIVDALFAAPRRADDNLPLRGRKVVVTAGPTRERIDPVRFITNRSSGKMGYAVAEAARDAGANVVIVSGPVNVPTPPGLKRVDVETAEQMMNAVQAEIADTRHLHCGGGGIGLPHARDRGAQDQEDQRRTVAAAFAYARHPRDGGGGLAASVRGGLRGRDTERRAQCAGQTRRQETGHDCCEPGGRRPGLRLRRQRTHGVLGRWQARTRARAQVSAGRLAGRRDRRAFRRQRKP